MSSLKLILQIVCFGLLLIPAAAKADVACPTKPQAWKLDKAVEFNGYGSCPLDVLSPDRRERLHIDTTKTPASLAGKIIMQVIFSDGRPPMAVSYRDYRYDIMYGSISVQWSPTGNAFLVDDSQGSAEGGLLRVFVRQGDQFVDDEAFQRKMEALYRAEYKCPEGGVAPTVDPLRWAADGKSFYVSVMRQVHGNCGEDFVTAKVNLATHKVERIYSPREAMRMFGKLIPP